MPDPYKCELLADFLNNASSSVQPCSCINLSEEEIPFPSWEVEGLPQHTACTGEAEKGRRQA